MKHHYVEKPLISLEGHLKLFLIVVEPRGEGNERVVVEGRSEARSTPRSFEIYRKA